MPLALTGQSALVAPMDCKLYRIVLRGRWNAITARCKWTATLR